MDKAIIYGYARCSTDETKQDIDRQKRELRALGVTDDTHIYWEYESGAKIDRVEFQKLLGTVRSGDTIATTEVSRLTRSTQHLCEILSFVQSNHIRLIIGSFVVDCRSEEIDPMSRGILMLMGVFAEMERDIIRQRIKSGMANAKAKGKKIGRPEVTKDSLPDKFWKCYNLYHDKRINISEFARMLNCTRPTIYKYLALVED